VVADVELVGVTKRYGNLEAVSRISLRVEQGEFFTLLGPSGCGKTTTLSLIAGFTDPTEGLVFLRGECVNYRPPYERNTAMVFQNYALFPHMTVWDNVAFGLRMRGVARAEVERRVGEALERVRLRGLEGRYPRQLSGGQQQRVALARAIVTQPAVLLLDEPLSNLDLKLREAMRLEIKALQRDLGITTIYVTHDQSEALVMSDRIAVMNHGRIEQVGSPAEIYERPVTPFVASFIGTTNFLRVRSLNVEPNGLASVVTQGGLELAAVVGSRVEGERLLVAIRPEKIQLTAEREGGHRSYRGLIRHAIYLGATWRYVIELESGEQIVVDRTSGDSPDAFGVGRYVNVQFPQHNCLVIAE